LIGPAETLASVEALALLRVCSVLGPGTSRAAVRDSAGQRGMAAAGLWPPVLPTVRGRAGLSRCRARSVRVFSKSGTACRPHLGSSRAASEEYAMIVLGIILLVIGLLTKIAVLWTIGIIVLVIGLVLLVLGLTGRAVGGRKYWY
jgi:hypothetical protein